MNPYGPRQSLTPINGERGNIHHHRAWAQRGEHRSWCIPKSWCISIFPENVTKTTTTGALRGPAGHAEGASMFLLYVGGIMMCVKSSVHQEFCTPRSVLSSLDKILGWCCRNLHLPVLHNSHLPCLHNSHLPSSQLTMFHLLTIENGSLWGNFFVIARMLV